MEKTIFTSLTPDQLRDLISEAVRIQLSQLNSIPSSNSTNPYLTREEAARILHISYPTLRDFVLRGKIRSYHIGRKVLFRKDEINAFFSSK